MAGTALRSALEPSGRVYEGNSDDELAGPRAAETWMQADAEVLYARFRQGQQEIIDSCTKSVQEIQRKAAARRQDEP